MKQNSRIQLENTLIGALGVLSLVLFILSFLPGLGLANRVGILLEMGHMVQRAFSVCIIPLCLCLYHKEFLLPPCFLTAPSVPKVPTRKQ